MPGITSCNLKKSVHLIQIHSLDTMDEWMKYGKKKMRIDDEISFIDEEILKKVLDCKTVFDNLEDKELRFARTKSNPFETIRSGIFQVQDLL